MTDTQEEGRAEAEEPFFQLWSDDSSANRYGLPHIRELLIAAELIADRESDLVDKC
jgi:hypothetical protein